MQIALAPHPMENGGAHLGSYSPRRTTRGFKLDFKIFPDDLSLWSIVKLDAVGENLIA